ncbi:hypothetical protein [Paraburkholderia franconis]
MDRVISSACTAAVRCAVSRLQSFAVAHDQHRHLVVRRNTALGKQQIERGEPPLPRAHAKFRQFPAPFDLVHKEVLHQPRPCNRFGEHLDPGRRFLAFRGERINRE